MVADLNAGSRRGGCIELGLSFCDRSRHILMLVLVYDEVSDESRNGAGMGRLCDIANRNEFHS